ncbi:sensor histidine kinase [Rasiella sp. SM2506]|uniref:sensor histidine kinase n=1 Tax=Rasiella sp. SM2506 TaxID=3423914 RepID=UPI003D791B6C
MIEEKLQQLEKTYRDWMAIQVETNTPLALLESLVTKDFMGYGTTLEEKLLGIEDLKKMIIAGREQAEQFEDFKFDIPKPVQRQLYPDNGLAIFVDEIDLKFKIGGIQNTIPLRVSTVLIFMDTTWKIVHWHVSVAVETEEGDTFHLDELQLKNQKLEKLVDERTAALKQSIADLKATQAQLIQSEKMASLGELTAGIAHEIQNPLNFVNNFSEVSNELIDEMNEEIDKGDIEEAKHISKDIKQNLEKITHHGKRADAIVKGMLQHSRKSTAEKEPTDINKLADEYLRLAYHGLRAKDKTFNATLETNFDESVGRVNVIPQDMGRVILNLITNAFYACAERSRSATNAKKSSFTETSEDSYKPTVSVSTKKMNNSIEISVKDNGNGIPQEIVDKIYEPFFTTKPTGEGTGLGLSMSYDIVTKGHGGELKVDTEKGKGTTFTIKLITN